MNALARQSETLERASALAADAQARYADYIALGGVDFGATETFADIERCLKDAARFVAGQIEQRRKRFASVAVLQATVSDANGATRRIPVSKPDAKCDEPHIGESFYRALLKRCAAPLVSMEDFPIVVLDRANRAVATIESDNARNSVFP